MSDVLATLAGLAPRRVLDFGCGDTGSHLDLPGFPSLRAVYPDARITGYEPGRDSKRAAATGSLFAPGGPPYSRGHRGGLPLPEPDGHFDLIAAINVLEHVRDLTPVLAELGRLLAPGGHLVVAVPEGRAFGDRLYRAHTLLRHGRRDHLRAWSRERWIAAIAAGTGCTPRGGIDKVDNLVWLPGPLARAGQRLLHRAARWPVLHDRPHLFVYGYLQLWQRPAEEAP